MLKSIGKIATVVIMALGFVGCISQAPAQKVQNNLVQDIQIYTTDNTNAVITPASIEKVFKDAGFIISANNDMNRAFKSKFNKTNHDLYHLMVFHKEDLSIKLININPKAALFAPLSMSIYTNKGSNKISVSTLSLEGMAKVTGISKTNKYMVELSSLVKKVIKKALPNGHFETTKYKILQPEGALVTSFQGEMDVSDDEIEDELEGFQEELEGSLETAGFVIAGFNQHTEALEESGNNKYDFFDAYSICKIAVIYEVSKKYPEAGAFAPCTFYMYKEKGSTIVHMSFPSVYNWISSLEINDKSSKEVLLKAQNAFTSTIKDVIE